MKNKKILLSFLTGGFFLCADQILKWMALHIYTSPKLVTPYIGWELFLNRGAAFSLPVGNRTILLFTAPIVAIVIYQLLRELKKNIPSYIFAAGCIYIILGALSNAFDRVVYGPVIDYILLGTAVINIADLMIVFGLVLYILHLSYPRHTASS